MSGVNINDQTVSPVFSQNTHKHKNIIILKKKDLHLDDSAHHFQKQMVMDKYMTPDLQLPPRKQRFNR